jgi:two-component sensor histidine kinase
MEIGEAANNLALSLLTYSSHKPDDKSYEDLSELLFNTIRLVRAEFRVANIEIDTDLRPVPLLEVSPMRLQQVCMSILNNALQAMPDGGRIGISLAETDDLALLTFTDNGHGISPEDLRRVFDPFFSTKGVWGHDSGRGTGMGLSVCRNIIEDHDGAITLDSVPGEGTSVRIALPLSAQKTAGPEEGSYQLPQRLIVMSTSDRFVSACRQMAADSSQVILVSHDFEDACGLLEEGEAVVVCDGGDSVRSEAYRLLRHCRQKGTKTVLANTGNNIYELGSLMEEATLVFNNIPALGELRDSLLEARD